MVDLATFFLAKKRAQIDGNKGKMRQKWWSKTVEYWAKGAQNRATNSPKRGRTCAKRAKIGEQNAPEAEEYGANEGGEGTFCGGRPSH